MNTTARKSRGPGKRERQEILEALGPREGWALIESMGGKRTAKRVEEHKQLHDKMMWY